MSATVPALDATTYASLDPGQRARLWDHLRTELAGSDWEPVATGIWAELLHERALAVDAWRGMTEPLPDGVVLARVLDISGPVPAPSKLPLLEALAADEGWHDPIVRAIWFAIFEDDGDIDVARARVLAARLRPTIAASEHEDVLAALEQLPIDCRNYADFQAREDGTSNASMPTLASARAARDLERRQGERRRRSDGPPAGVGERRRTPDRRGMWSTMAPVHAGHESPGPMPGEHVSAWRILVPVVAGSAASIALGVWSNVHDPTGQALPALVFSATINLKVWCTTAAATLGLLQLVSSLRMFEVVRIPRAWPAWLPAAHRWNGTLAILLTLPVVYHCMWALGFQDYTTRVLAHSLLGCAFYGALVAKVVTRHAPRMPRHLGMPLFGGLLFATLTGVWLTSSLWFFRNVGFPAF